MNIEKRIITKILENERKLLRTFMSENRKIRCGSIKKRKKGNKYYYTECIKGKEIGITKNADRIRLLYRKKYLKSSIIKSKVIIKCMENLIGELNEIFLDEECLRLGMFSQEEWKWMQADYDRNPLYPERLVYKTLLGTMVRSKSELNIANILERLGIPYRYEQKIFIDGVYYYPDFTILLPNWDVLIWEHNGLMEDLSDASRAYEKVRKYEDAGYRQHTNLIITYEDDIRTPEQIEKIISRFLFL